MTTPQAAPAARKRPFLILVIDGGPLALLAVLFLKELEAAHPGALSRVDLFAGTSSGAMTSAILARDANPGERINAAETFWRDAAGMLGNSFFGYLMALIGLRPIFDNKKQLAALSSPAYLGDAKLGDLEQRVALVAFEVDPPDPDADWQTRVFSNLEGWVPGDRERAAADVALSSGSAPVVLAIHDGCVDGGVSANNPSMLAVAAAIKAARASGTALSVGDVHVLSIGFGGGRLTIRNSQWGYGQWLFNPFRPLLLIRLLLSGETAGTDEAVTTLLPDGQYRRVLLKLDGTTSRRMAMGQRPVTRGLDTDLSHIKTLAVETADWLRAAAARNEEPTA